MENLDESWPSGALSFSCEIDSCSSWATARNVLPHLDLTGVVFRGRFFMVFQGFKVPHMFLKQIHMIQIFLFSYARNLPQE